MKIFDTKNTRVLFIILGVFFLGCIAIGQIMVSVISNDFKEELITHDYAVAGYLYRNNSDQSQIAKSFTAKKKEEDFKKGQELLQYVGYHNSINNNLIPDVKSFQKKYSVLVLVVSAMLSLGVILILLGYVVRQDKKLEMASLDISKFMNGDYSIRLSGNEEGSLSKLFSVINTMATSLTTHIDKEKKNKEFLKETISDISHQLKTPLAALEMYNEIIQDEKSDNEVVERFTRKSMDELNRMENLIQNLLKLAKIDANAMELEKLDYNLKEFLESIIKRFYTRVEFENKIITLNCDDSILLRFDEAWMLEAVSNIIKNALDHTEEQDEIKIICYETPLMVTIKISDNGLGIHPDDIYNIFKRFYRSQFSKDKQGIGIGLTLSKTIVEKHGGTITVESQLGKGTDFLVSFPKLTNL